MGYKDTYEDAYIYYADSGTILNQWSDSATNDHGLRVIPVANSGNRQSALVAFIGWNTKTFPQQGTVSVADDAHNYWVPMVETATAADGMRGAIWIAAGAEAASAVSISATFPVSGIASLIAEVSSLPTYAQADFAPASAGGTTGTGVTVSATAGVADWVFALAVTGDNAFTTTAPGSPWTALTQVAVNDPAGAGGPADVRITPVMQQASAGALSAAFTASGTVPFVAAMGGIRQTPTPPASPNPSFPAFAVQAAFGAQPGNPQATYTWTDISAYAILDDTGVILDTTKGRYPELTGPEAGTIKIWLNNQTGVFTPGNTSSPYYPNILPETPIRVTAVWQGIQYPVAYGYVDKWPQQWPQPQWGFTPLSASDSVGVLAQLTILSAYQSEVLIDRPGAYWTLGEDYGAPAGLPFQNLGANASNTKPMLGVNTVIPAVNALSTGLSLNLQGDTGTGIGMSGLTGTADQIAAGAIYVDPSLASPMTATGGAVEFWHVSPTTNPTSGTYTTPLVSLLGSFTNFSSGGGPVRFQVVAVQGTPNTMQVSLADFLGNSATLGAFKLPADGNSHHHVYNIAYSSGTWTVSHYVDGVFDAQVTNTTVTVANTNDVTMVALGPALITPLHSTPFNYTLGHVAIYGQGPLNPQRILSHYQAGALGVTGDNAVTRYARILAWGASTVPSAAVAASPTPLIGSAFSVQGQAVTDAVNDLLTAEGGWAYADASGNAWYWSRTRLYDQAPKWVFSDNPADGGTYYLPDAAFDFDNSILYSQVYASREIGQSDTVTTSATQGALVQQFQNFGAQIRVTSPQGQTQFGQRNSLQQTIITTSDQDTYDRAEWSLNKYSYPSYRIPRIVIDAAANPLLWPVALGAEQGDVVKVLRHPVGAPAYTILGVIAKTQLQVGPNKGQAIYSIVPYSIEANILQADNTSYNTLAQGIGW